VLERRQHYWSPRRAYILRTLPPPLLLLLLLHTHFSSFRFRLCYCDVYNLHN